MTSSIRLLYISCLTHLTSLHYALPFAALKATPKMSWLNNNETVHSLLGFCGRPKGSSPSCGVDRGAGMARSSKVVSPSPSEPVGAGRLSEFSFPCGCTGRLAAGHWVSRGSKQQPRVKAQEEESRSCQALRPEPGEFQHFRSKQSQASLSVRGRKRSSPTHPVPRTELT